MSRATLTILIPALNEESSIETAVMACAVCRERVCGDGRLAEVEVIVVDDGSTDDTPALLEQMAVDQPFLRVLTHPENRGLGAALRTGFAAASTDYLFYTDADLPVDLLAVDEALELLTDDVDAISAFRRSRRGEGPRRYVYSLAYNLLCRVVLRLAVHDVNFAAKMFRTEQLHELDLRSEGSFIDAELLARIHRRGGTIVQFPADYRPRSRGVSTLSATSVVMTIIVEMLRLTPSIRRRSPPRSRRDG